MSLSEELEKLELLREEGVLSDEEFRQAKQTVLNGGSASAFAGGSAADPERLRQQTNLWAMLLHFSQFAGYLVPFAGLVVPIVIWQLKKNDLPAIDNHGKVVTNWIISEIIYVVVSALLVLLLIGIPLLIAVVVLGIVFPIIGGIKANSGELWRYPLSISFFAIAEEDDGLQRYE
jgi:hypothetical protein